MLTKNALPLHELQTLAGDPLEKARALPSWVYTDPRFLALEQDRIFAPSWQCVGRADTLPNHGDFLATALAGEPVILIRSSSGELRAMSNVCRHRMSTLLEGRGNVRRIVCPYHAWTYDLNGHLCGAAEMGRNEMFSVKEIRLPPVRCEEWLGFVFLTLDANIPAPAERFSEVTALVHAYEMEHYVESFRDDLRWDANWKLVAENFMESYHLPRCHSGTVGGDVKLKDLQDVVPGDGFNYHRILRDDKRGLTAAHPDNKRLDGNLRQTTWVLAIYPSLMITLTPGYFWYLCISPDGPRNVDLTFGGGMAPDYALDDRADRLFAETRRLTRAIIEEDSVCVQRVFRGLQSSLAEPGPLSHLESGSHGFARWICSRVVD